MKISVFGLGYVGTVSSACLASDGHNVIGLDVDKNKIDFITQGKSPIFEPGLDLLVAEQVKEKRLSVSSDISEVILKSEVSIVCVGTPSTYGGNLDLKYIKKVLSQIGHALKNKQEDHIIVMRSTVPPGTARKIAIPILEKFSKKTLGNGFSYISNPEFLRESTAIFDFINPPKTVIGQSDLKSGNKIAELYQKLDAPLIQTRIGEAEIVKYADNAWHATKVVFANEIGNLAKGLGVDGQKVMDIFCKDEKLNLSSYYMKPGFAFGGSCLPKDVRAINAFANELNIRVPLMSSIIKSNLYQIERTFSLIAQTKKTKIAILGISFKADTDDVRESPQLLLLEKLLGKGYDIKVYDSNVSKTLKEGATKKALSKSIEHIVPLMSDSIDEAIEFSEVVIIGNASKEFDGLADKICEEKIVLDLVRSTSKTSGGNYIGLCW